MWSKVYGEHCSKRSTQVQDRPNDRSALTRHRLATVKHAPRFPATIVAVHHHLCCTHHTCESWCRFCVTPRSTWTLLETPGFLTNCWFLHPKLFESMSTQHFGPSISADQHPSCARTTVRACSHAPKALQPDRCTGESQLHQKGPHGPRPQWTSHADCSGKALG